MEYRYLFKAKDCNSIWRAGLLIALKEDRCAIEENDGSKWACVSETLCQCTGLKDKNGNLIWENDIVKDNVIFGSVSWDDINARFFIDDIQDGYQDYSDWWHEVQVIGNIFDNPELLEVAE